MFEAFFVALSSVWADSGFSALTGGHVIMICVGLLLLYMAIAKGFEPLLLSPIAFGCILANIPKNGFEEPGVMSVIMYGIHHEVFPPLIFLGVGAMTDFGPLLANPKTLLLGAAAQAGVFVALLGAMLLGFSVQEAAAIGIIGGADGPTSIYLAAKMAPQLLGAIAVAAYSYMSLVPLIQPPIMKLFTTEADRKIVMQQLRPVSHFEKVAFPIMCTIVISLLLPSVTALIGMLMLGNLFKEAGCLDRLSDTAQNALMNTVTIMLATGTGLTMSADAFLNYQTILIIILGLVAFIGGTAAGVIFGKLMCIVDGGKTNPLIGSAGVSAVPMAARVSQVVGQKANPSNFLLMHAMGPNVAGVIGTAVAAGTMLAMIGPVGK
ncbi:sodium ion-translocating decarboxylase subunit beta [Phascolarctobacterium succinatutens]|jgi:sodium ion-translocating decarboxylase beta subunit|uniref:sodium ion-translocating decarboxylase subunit beta n=3 Tax=Phascolarctobacterium succinatutens TaxID=626940 RepID=UPI00201B4BB9|nr:sodium ion-translocating decarboxylase subunit beta [Phascolarctobacterium succinatutens]MDY3840881.1 sodium ion-translocating decarboxylase subunit beta [Phascolarctobacterium succinatutens]UQT42427.1 sodium ion-translocating decarboxylase subunit beta [Phascolarctobacterium succinatutens]